MIYTSIYLDVKESERDMQRQKQRDTERERETGETPNTRPQNASKFYS